MEKRIGEEERRVWRDNKNLDSKKEKEKRKKSLESFPRNLSSHKSKVQISISLMVSAVALLYWNRQYQKYQMLSLCISNTGTTSVVSGNTRVNLTYRCDVIFQTSHKRSPVVIAWICQILNRSPNQIPRDKIGHRKISAVYFLLKVHKTS